MNGRVSNSFQSRERVEESLLAEAALRDALDLFLRELAFFGLGARLACGSFGGENSNEFDEGCSPMGKSTAEEGHGLELKDRGADIYGVD